MLDHESFDDGGDSTVFRDVIMLALLGFVTIVILLLPHLNPPTLAEENVVAPGNVIVEVRWPDDLDADVDLWVQAPGDQPVGYSNKGGRIFNLLRDDLGSSSDETNLNYEVAFTRGTPSGHYTINLHLYRINTGHLPIDAIVSVGVKPTAGGTIQRIASKRVALDRTGQELTVLRFSLDADGRLVPGSIHDLPRPLRSARG